MKEKLEKCIKRSEAADILGVCTRTLARYERQGKLTPIKFSSRSVRYRESELIALQNNGLS